MYGLSLAQPALCSPVESDSIHGVGMYMEAPSVLRYGTFVEIMVPLFSMSFFRGNVTHTLSTSVSGVPSVDQHLNCKHIAAFVSSIPAKQSAIYSSETRLDQQDLPVPLEMAS